MTHRRGLVNGTQRGLPARAAVGVGIMAALERVVAITLAAALGVPAVLGSVAAQEPEPPDVAGLLRGFDELYESTGTTARIEIEIVTPRKTRTLRLRSWSQGEERALLVIDAPARDAGTATLKVGNNLWNYLPRIARTIRVPPSMMMGSWMGSDLTHDDLVSDSSYEEDYVSTLIGRTSEPPGWRIGLIARPELVGLWNRVEIDFAEADRLPVRVAFFDRKDRLARTMRLGEVREVGGRRIPTRVTVVPEREAGHQTVLRYLSVTFDVEIEETMFSLAALERRH